MFDFTIGTKLSATFILSKVSEETIFSFYTGEPVDKRLKVSKLRSDNKPTCGYYRGKYLYLRDFATNDNFNCFEYVMRKYCCNYHTALRIIANDFGLICDKTIPKNKGKINKDAPVFKDTGPALIQIEMKDFSKSELEWWNDYGITSKILKKYHVFSCKNVFLNSNVLASSSDHNPIYGYYGGKKDGVELWRIYFPKRKSYRFISNWDSKKIQGLKQLPDKGKLLVITKSLKDVMTLYSLGIHAIAPNSETLFIPDSLLEELKERFENIVVLYDNDLAGVSNMKKIRDKYGMKCMWIPRKLEAKDISDYHKKYGRKKTLELIKNAVLWLSRQKKLLQKK